MLGFAASESGSQPEGGSMKRNFTNEQIIYTLRQVEGGTAVAEVCRKMGITEQTFY
jgi:transposase-like protein